MRRTRWHQRLACRRGAFDLRAVINAPTAPESEAKEFADWFHEEVRLVGVAMSIKAPYVPSRRDRRVVGGLHPEIPPTQDPDMYMPIEEPSNDEDAFDERMVASARGYADDKGVARVELTVAEPRREALARWSRARIGRTVSWMLKRKESFDETRFLK